MSNALQATAKTAHSPRQHATARHAENAETIQVAMPKQDAQKPLKTCSLQQGSPPSSCMHSVRWPSIDMRWCKEAKSLSAACLLATDRARARPPSLLVCQQDQCAPPIQQPCMLVSTCIHDRTPCCGADGTVMLVMSLGMRLSVLFVCAGRLTAQLGGEGVRCSHAAKPWDELAPQRDSPEPADFPDKQYQRGSP